ncbi:MAG: sugar transferase [Nitrospirae bacterium]|nr:MAG: sugar transferase [Nitrospirota bacterium]
MAINSISMGQKTSMASAYLPRGLKFNVSSIGKGGYSKAFKFINAAFNFIFALFFIVCSLPLFLVIALIIKLQDGGEVFYRGVRLGIDKKPFIMYKFRTLVPDAERVIGAELLSPKHRLETKFGKFLRDTRLDELPQLINVLKGDMDFVGPRPERPLIYEQICRHIKNYDKRFMVRPGLIGYSQLFTPHSAPKEIRTLIDNHFLDVQQNFFFEVGLMFFTMMIVLRKFSTKLLQYSVKAVRALASGRKYEEKRTAERVMPDYAKVSVGEALEGGRLVKCCEASLVDINHEAFLIKSSRKLPSEKIFFELETGRRSKANKRSKIKSALCEGEVYKEMPPYNGDGEWSYVVKYRPVSRFNFYIVHQYFLRESVAV